MKNWIAILAILIVALAPIAIAEETTEDSAGKGRTEERMDKAQERVDNAKEMREERKEMVQQKREDIRSLRDEIRAACEADKQSDACKEARTKGRDTKHNLLERIANKMGPTFKRAEMLENRLAKIVEHLTAKGKDTSGLDTGAISAKIAEAQALFDEGKSFMEQARAAEPGQKDGLMKQAAQKFRAANKTLKDARGLIRDWLKSVKQKDPNAVEESSTAPAAEETAAPVAEETAAPESTDAPIAEETAAPESTPASTDDSSTTGTA